MIYAIKMKIEKDDGSSHPEAIGVISNVEITQNGFFSNSLFENVITEVFIGGKIKWWHSEEFMKLEKPEIKGPVETFNLSDISENPSVSLSKERRAVTMTDPNEGSLIILNKLKEKYGSLGNARIVEISS